jgi:hypothetical protein
MSSVDSIFLDVDEPVGEVAGWVAGVLSLEPVSGPVEDGVAGLHGPAVTGDGVVGYAVRKNGYVSYEPDEMQAIDAYPVEIDIRYGGAEEVLAREARRAFDALVEARPEIAILLCNELTTVVVAHLPGVGTHEFEPDTSMDAPDLDKWGPWVRRRH